MKKLVLLFGIIHSLSNSYAQIDYPKKEILPVLGFHFQYGIFQPVGKMNERFGFDNAIQLSVDHLSKSNWVFGGDGQYFFGKKVKEDPLAKLRVPEGFLIGNDQALADVQLRERGFYVGAFLGHVFSKTEKDRVNGLRVTVGAGYLQHKIRIQDNSGSATQVSGQYIKGYDRQTGGPAFAQFVGYQFYSHKKLINFFAGANFQEGLTKSLRSYNFDEKKADTASRVDVRMGLIAGWSLPFYIGDKGEDVYY